MKTWHDLTELEPAVLALAQALRARSARLVTAESCTGGLIAAACTAVSGSSDWFERGYVTYSNEAKHESIGVDPALIAAHGAVSEPVALAMAEGALRHSGAQLAVAVTGVAGPTGGTPDKPVGTVWLAIAWRWSAEAAVGVQAQRLQLAGDRAAVRGQTVARALTELLRVGAAR